MLQPDDAHIDQITISLQSIVNYGKDLLDHCNCHDNVKKMILELSNNRKVDPNGLGSFDVAKMLPKDFLDNLQQVESIKVGGADMISNPIFDQCALHVKYPQVFAKFTMRFGEIIQGLHMHLAVKDCQVKTEEELIEFEKAKYDVDIRQLK